MTDDDAAPSPRDIVDQEAVSPPASAAPEANRASFNDTMIDTSTTSTGLADAGVPPTEWVVDSLLTRAALQLNMAEADAVDVASHRAPPSHGEVEPGWLLPPAAAGIRRPSDDPPPSTSGARPPPKDEESTRPAICDESYDSREDEKQEEGEDDEAPLPPEMVAAAFEEAKPELINDDEHSPVPPGQIAASFEGHGYEEEKREEIDDEEAPRPPEMIGYDSEEEKPKIASAHEDFVDMVNRVMQEIDEAFNNDETPVNRGNRESLLDPSSSSNQALSTTSNVQVDSPSITPSHQSDNGPSLPVSGQGHLICSTQEQLSQPRPDFGPSYQSIPQLEATLVQDVPVEPVYIYVANEGPVYDAIPVSATQDNNLNGWSRISQKCKVIILGLILVATAMAAGVGWWVARYQNESSKPFTEPPVSAGGSPSPTPPVPLADPTSDVFFDIPGVVIGFDAAEIMTNDDGNDVWVQSISGVELLSNEVLSAAMVEVRMIRGLNVSERKLQTMEPVYVSDVCE